MQPVVVANEAELRKLIRDRIAELGTTYGAVDAYAGLPERYTSRLLAPVRLRRFGNRSLPLLLQALALGVAQVTFVEDPALAATVRKRLAPRRRRVSSHRDVAAKCDQGEMLHNKEQQHDDNR